MRRTAMSHNDVGRNVGRWSASWLILGLLTLGGCASVDVEDDEINDPGESVNRAVFQVNTKLDRAFLEPLSELYVFVTPNLVQDSVFNFFGNLAYPGVIVNDFLQGKVEQGFADAGRFVFNSTLGIGGLFDISTGLGLPAHEEDFGQTLGVWGVGEGPYLELLFAGPSTLRDLPNIPIGLLTNVGTYVPGGTAGFALGVVNGADTRARLDSVIELRDSSALDPYVYQREAYRQRRKHLIYDGNPPIDDFDLLSEDDQG